MFTLQETFTKVANHLIAQGTRSKADTATCLYRGDNGTKCAVGHLIPDELYTEAFEGVGLQGVVPEAKPIRQVLATLGYIPQSDVDQLATSDLSSMSTEYQLLAALQRCHDVLNPEGHNDTRELWRHRLHAIAQDYGLVNPHPPTTDAPQNLYGGN